MITSRRQSTHSNLWAPAVVVGIVAVLYFAREILIPFSFALVFAFLLTPAVLFFQRLRFGRVPSSLLVVALALTLAGWLGWIMMHQLVDVAERLPMYRSNIDAKLEALRVQGKGPLGRAAGSIRELQQAFSEAELPSAKPGQPRTVAPLPVQVVEPATNPITYLQDWGSRVLGPVGLAGIVLILTIFMLINREDLRNRLLRLAGLGQLNVMTQALDDAAHRVSRFLLLQFLVNASFGTLIGLGLYAIGVPSPALWGLLAGVLRFVPYVGAIISAGLPLLLSLAVFNSWLQPLLVLMLFLVLDLSVANAVEPLLFGAHTGISSLALLISAIFWAALWGPAGLVLATPLTVCVVVLGRYVPQLAFLHILLGDEQVLAAEAQLYQRLLAMDPQEARSIVDQFLSGKPLLELYDSVFIPALTMAEQDRHRGAIDATREQFLFLTINDMVAEFSEYKPSQLLEQAATSFHKPRVFCLPAHDQGDEVTAAMLAQLLEQEGYTALAFPMGTTVQEIALLADPMGNDVVCVSSLPPYAFTPARALCKQLQSHLPTLKVLVGVWGFTGDTEKAKARFERAPPYKLLTSLSQALQEVKEVSDVPV